MSLNDVERLKSLHKQCRSCLLPIGRKRINKTGTRCRITIDGLVLAIDCDNCTGFDRDKKPDIVALQKCDNRLTWILIEVKEHLEASARHQIASGLAQIGSRRLLQTRAERAEAYFAYRRSVGHRSVYKALANLRLTFGGERVPVEIVRCPVKINCRDRESSSTRQHRRSS